MLTCIHYNYFAGSVFWFSLPYKPDELAASFFHRVTSTTAFGLRTPTSTSTDDNNTINTTINTNNNNSKDKASSSGIGCVSMNPTCESLKILLVDDSISILKMTGVMLRRQGHTVTEAVNGAEALDMLVSGGVGRYDVVLMDIQVNCCTFYTIVAVYYIIICLVCV